MPPEGTTVASVNGRPILRDDLVGLLVRSHGVAVLEQLIGLDLAIAAATEHGVGVTQSDVDQEHVRALRHLINPLAPISPDPFDRETAERLLETVLTQRNISRVEYDLIIRRNAYLRKIAEAQVVVTDSQLRDEFDRRYGERAQVRHIQLATLAEVQRVKDRLTRGEGFGDLAVRYSANQSSALREGRLDPFSATDEEVPALLREVAFSLEPDAVSSAVRIGEWYHLIKLEAILPARQGGLKEVRAEIEESLRDRLTDAATFGLFEKLFRQATIDVYDPWLEAAFEQRHADRTVSGPEPQRPESPGAVPRSQGP
ncbi:MAG: peptidylprolyl isomerase [Phycisphaerae bacterium]